MKRDGDIGSTDVRACVSLVAVAAAAILVSSHVLMASHEFPRFIRASCKCVRYASAAARKHYDIVNFTCSTIFYFGVYFFLLLLPFCGHRAGSSATDKLRCGRMKMAFQWTRNGIVSLGGCDFFSLSDDAAVSGIPSPQSLAPISPDLCSIKRLLWIERGRASTPTICVTTHASFTFKCHLFVAHA